MLRNFQIGNKVNTYCKTILSLNAKVRLLAGRTYLIEYIYAAGFFACAAVLLTTIAKGPTKTVKIMNEFSEREGWMSCTHETICELGSKA